MMRSLWSAVSGLQTHQLEMDVIGNNIANVNTTAYKSQATGFQDVLYQTIKTGSAGSATKGSTSADQVGLGAKMGSININITKPGSAQTTYNPFDLMITGDSFFVVSESANSPNQEKYFTRDGSFTIDAAGSLVTTNNGLYVNFIEGVGTVGATGSLINEATKTIAGSSTTEGYFKGNIDENDPNVKAGKILRLEVFGDDGEKYTLKFNIQKEGTEVGVFSLTLQSVLDADGKSLQGITQQTVPLTYGKNDGKLTSAETASFNYGKGTISIDLSNTSNYASPMGNNNSTISGYRGNTKGLNQGYANGNMTGLSISDNGEINAKYSNGQTVLLAQIVVAEFSNAMGLEKVGDNLYSASLNSGEPIYMDITEDGGYMSSGVLEASNVDLAKEFTDMITTQRGFQANSRVITTSDELLQVLKNLKR